MTYNPNDYDIFIGMDTDKRSIALTVQNHYTMKKSKKIPSNPENLYSYISKQFKGKKVICAYEADLETKVSYKERDPLIITKKPKSVIPKHWDATDNR